LLLLSLSLLRALLLFSRLLRLFAVLSIAFYPLGDFPACLLAAFLQHSGFP
jgi:hypothetical protein